MDMLLNVAIFIWFGAVCPWPSFSSSIIPLWRLPVLAIVVLLLRRPLPFLLIHWLIPQVNGLKQALFMGFFGPIGVSAIFYQHFALEFLLTEVLASNGEMREDAKILSEMLRVVVWFVVLSSIVSVRFFFSSLYLYGSVTDDSVADCPRHQHSYLSSMCLYTAPYAPVESYRGRENASFRYLAEGKTACLGP